MRKPLNNQHIVLLKIAIERVMKERGLSWSAVALSAGKAPNSLHRIRDGKEERVEWGTVRAVVEGLGLSYSEFFADSPEGARGRLATALSALPREDTDVILGILQRLAVQRPAKQRAQIGAVAEAMKSQTGT